MKHKLLLIYLLLMATVTATSATLSTLSTDPWTIAGAEAICGISWDPTATENEMTTADGVTYKLTKEGCKLEGNLNYSYKVVRNYSWADEHYGAENGQNAKLKVDENGIYTVTFTFVYHGVNDYVLSATATKTSEFEPGKKVWTIAGVADLLGVEWDPAAAQNDMKQIENGVYQLVKKNIVLYSGYEYAYKIVANHSWDENYGENGVQDGLNLILSVTTDGVYNVTFTFFENSKELSVEAKYISNSIELANAKAFYYVGSMNEWSPTDKSYPLALLSDNETWEMTFTADHDEWFKIAPDFAYDGSFWDNLLCSPYDDCSELSGDIVYGDYGAWHFLPNDTIDHYTILINPSKMRYEIIPFKPDFGSSGRLAIFDENGNDITAQVSILWHDSNGNQIGEGSSLGGVEKGTEVYYSVILGNVLGRKYREIIKQKTIINGETVKCTLVPIKEVTLHGKVQAYGTPLPRVEVNLTQWLNGKYENTTNTLTEANGEFTLNAYNDSTELIVLANGYIDNKIIRQHLNNGGELGTIEMNEVHGKVIALNLSYQEATKEGVEPNVQNWYSDTRNIGYNVQNLSKGTEITDYAIQQGNIVLPTGTDRGDRVQITVSSLNEKFNKVTAEGFIADNDTAKINITLLAFGGIEAVYGQKSDDNLLAMLYDSNGKLQMRTVCASSHLTFTNLAAGTYSLVTMGYNGAIGSVADISDLANMNLAEDQDYVRSTANVRDGYISSINVASVPELDASKFEYTGMNTSYMPNKTQLVAGNYITLTARLDFKEQYSGKTDNVKLVVEIPEGCEFVPNSVVIGAKPIPHSLNGDKLTITVDKEDLDRRIRFCVLPTQTGIYMTSAYAEFDYKGTKTQPIGQIRFESTSGDYYVPSTTRTPTIMVGGIGVPKADVEVYDNDALIGTTRSLGNGKWSLNCELNNAYNLSTHSIYVKYRGEGNVVGKTDAKDCFYDINAIVVQSVTMLNTAHPAGNLTPTQYSSVWDFHALTSSKDYYLYWPEYPDFTFLVNLSENDTTKVSDVVLSVYTMDGDVRRLPATYDGKHGCFVATSSFDSYSTPVNVSVELRTNTPVVVDRAQLQAIDDDINNLIQNYNSSDADSPENNSSNLYDFEMDAEFMAYINSLSEAQIEELINDTTIVTSFLAKQEEFRNFVDSLFASDFSSITTVEGIVITNHPYVEYTDEELINNGYEAYQLTDGNSIFIKRNKDFLSFIDRTSKTYYDIYNPNNLHDNSESRLFLNRASSEDIRKKLVEFTKKMTDALSTINERYRKIEERFGNLLKAFEENEKEAKYVINVQSFTLSQKLKKLERLEAELATETNLQQQGLKQLEIQKIKNEISAANKYLTEAKKKLKNANNAIKDVKYLKGWLRNVLPAATYASLVHTAIANMRRVASLAEQVPKECKCYESELLSTQWEVISFFTTEASYLSSKFIIEACNDLSSVGGLIATGGTALPVVGLKNMIKGIVVNLLADYIHDKIFDAWEGRMKRIITELQKRCAKKDCHDDDNDDKNIDDKNIDDKNNRKNKDPKTKEDDPSGFVYEAVPTNRIEGVKATIYYAEDGETDYPIQWNAAEFGQVNPQITEGEGLYAWDVPQGLWKVIFEKEGYETTQTDWLPVPPPQLEINIPMSQAVAPYVENALGAESGITLDFSKYMKPNTLTKGSRVTVTCNGEKASGDVELLNLEENPFNNEEYASKIKFVPNKSFKTTDEVIITVKKEVESYASKQMTEDFVQRVKIESEIKEIACDSVMAVDYHGTGILDVSVLPAAAAKGRTIQVASTSSMIASTDAQSVTLNDEGKARIVVSGELPGSTSLHLSMPDAGKEKYVAVSVVTKEEQVVKTPKASKLSGSTMEDSYLLTLTCATKGATIYYTIDGSCPCDEQTRKKYTGPITLPEGQITLQAVAVREGMVDSDVAEFTYTVIKDEANGIRLIEESHDFEASYQDGSIIVSGAKGASCHIYDIQGRELGGRNILNNQSRINVPKTDVYVVSVLFNNGQTIVHKIMAK